MLRHATRNTNIEALKLEAFLCPAADQCDGAVASKSIGFENATRQMIPGKNM